MDLLDVLRKDANFNNVNSYLSKDKLPFKDVTKVIPNKTRLEQCISFNNEINVHCKESGFTMLRINHEFNDYVIPSKYLPLSLDHHLNHDISEIYGRSLMK